VPSAQSLLSAGCRCLPRLERYHSPLPERGLSDSLRVVRREPHLNTRRRLHHGHAEWTADSFQIAQPRERPSPCFQGGGYYAYRQYPSVAIFFGLGQPRQRDAWYVSRFQLPCSSSLDSTEAPSGFCALTNSRKKMTFVDLAQRPSSGDSPRPAPQRPFPWVVTSSAPALRTAARLIFGWNRDPVKFPRAVPALGLHSADGVCLPSRIFSRLRGWVVSACVKLSERTSLETNREIRTSGLMSGEGKRGGALRPCSRPHAGSGASAAAAFRRVEQQ